jgi:hypothetical protein
MAHYGGHALLREQTWASPRRPDQASMIRRYIIWRNNHAYDERLRRIVGKANVA